jgi:hypothetical protein
LVGYIESSATEGVLLTVQRLEFTDIEVIRPDEFKKLENKNDYQYFVTIVLDQDERKEIIDIIDNLNLDCISFVDDTCLIHESAKIGKGVIIFGFSLSVGSPVRVTFAEILNPVKAEFTNAELLLITIQLSSTSFVSIIELLERNNISP